jgi:ABC-type lipoprotein release transport system permease subunit
MRVLLLISWRNLIRQKRRNVLLGIAIAFGVVVLTVSSSFSRGITVTLLDRLVVYVAGHVKVNMVERGNIVSPIVRDRNRILAVIKETVPEVKGIHEDVNVFCRAVGNGKGDYGVVMGVKMDKDFRGYLQVDRGSLTSFDEAGIHNPVVISESKAKHLNVDIGDKIRIRFQNINNQNQTAILSVVAITKSQNMFMDYAMYTPVLDMRKIAGYKENETGAFKLILKDPTKAVAVADKLHKVLQPKMAYIKGTANNLNDIFCVPFSFEALDKDILKAIKIKSKKLWDLDEKGAVVSIQLAQKLGKKVGDKIEVNFKTKYGEKAQAEFEVAALAYFRGNVPDTWVLVNNKDFFRVHNFNLPENTGEVDNYFSLNTSSKLKSGLATEWYMMKRTSTTKQFNKKIKDFMRKKQVQPAMDVASMYETASDVIKLEKVFNLVTFMAAAVIFFIVMIGVFNSLRMSLRERTREIGTIRAVGMNKKGVRSIFLLETMMLTVISWVCGVAGSFGVMRLLTLHQFSAENFFNMFMVDRRLFFQPTVGMVLFNLFFVLVFTIVTAYFPARSAANLEPADALRHMN